MSSNLSNHSMPSVSASTSASIFFDHLFHATDCRQIPASKQQLLRHYFECFSHNGLLAY